MRLQRQLNIDNTYRVLNLNFFPKYRHWIKVCLKNQHKILKSLQENKGEKYTYYIDQQDCDDLRLIQLIFGSKGRIIYYTDEAIPISIFLKIGTNRKALYLYKLQDFDKDLINNIETASICSTTAVYVPNVKASDNPFSYIFQANDVRFIADRMYIDFNSKVTPKQKEQFFDRVHEVLARWTIQLFISYNNEKEHQKLKHDIIKKYN